MSNANLLGDLATATPATLLSLIHEHRRLRRWAETAALAPCVPAGALGGTWLLVADEIGFALGQLRRTREAAGLLERTFAAEPTRRRASALAYLYYDALFASRRGPEPLDDAESHEPAVESRSTRNRRGEPAGGRGAPRRDREALRLGFTRWTQEALRLEPDSIRDLYRLGVFEAQLQSRRDVAALRAFERAIAAYRKLAPETRSRRHDLRKPYLLSLYAAARSALRLGRHSLGRQLIFACIREDKSDHVEPLYKLYLAGRILAAQGQALHAERAYRLALDAAGPPERSFVHGALAELARAAGDLEQAKSWISQVPEHRRGPQLWRLLGDVERDGGDASRALVCYQNALRRDRAGRHLTLVRIGEIHRAAGRLKDAERAFSHALDFRRRFYASDDRTALSGLRAIAEARGQPDEAAALARRLGALDAERPRRYRIESSA